MLARSLILLILRARRSIYSSRTHLPKQSSSELRPRVL